jgi:hypothetical protein
MRLQLDASLTQAIQLLSVSGFAVRPLQLEIGVAGFHYSGLVGEHDRLHAVTDA